LLECAANLADVCSRFCCNEGIPISVREFHWVIVPEALEAEMSESPAGSDRMTASKKIHLDLYEFYRSQGAPSVAWLERLNAQGQRECIRQWIVRSRSPEIAWRLSGFADRICEAEYQERPYLPETAEELVEYGRARRRASLESLEEKIRYGAIDSGETDWKQYNRYQAICDEEWRNLVEAKPSRGTAIRWAKRFYAVLAVFLALEAVGRESVFYGIAAVAVGGCVLFSSHRDT
jgi:hypothetical protein